MAGQYDNTNTGVLFQNERKQSDKHPDYNGSVNVNGVEYWLNGWKKKSTKDGKPFLSLALKPKEQQPQQQDRQQEQRQSPPRRDEDTPF